MGEELNLILDEIRSMKEGIQKVNMRMDRIESKVDTMESNMAVIMQTIQEIKEKQAAHYSDLKGEMMLLKVETKEIKVKIEENDSLLDRAYGNLERQQFAIE